MSALGDLDDDEADVASDGEGDDAPTLYYPSVDVFVSQWLAPTYRRHFTRTRIWCPHWWAHAEAVVRLEAIWRAWEHLRLEPATGISVWLRDHADVHMAALMDFDGPFYGCNMLEGHKPRASVLEVVEPPPGMFDTDLDLA